VSSIQNFFTSRDNNTTANVYVGQLDRLWYDPVTNAIYVSDGSTPGGIAVGFTGSGNGVPGGPVNSVQYNAGSGIFGGTSNISINSTTGNLSVTGNVIAGYFYGDGGNITNLPLANYSGNITAGNVIITGNITTIGTANLGNFTISDQTLAGTVTDRNIILAVVGNANVEVLGGFQIHNDGNTEGAPALSVAADGQSRFYVPVLDLNAGAVEIVGTTSGQIVAPGNPGAMLHVTGQNNQVSRVLNDAVNNYPLYVGRRYNGTAAAPTGVLAGQVISRLGANPYLTDAAQFAGLGTARIDFIATEDQTTAAQGSRITMNVTPGGSNVQSQVAEFNYGGITLTGNLTPLTDNIYSLGNVTNRWVGAYFGNAGIYMQDTTLGTTGQLSLDNGVFVMDNNISALQISTANAIQLTTNGLVTTVSTRDITLGTVGDTGNTAIKNAGIKFNDGSVQTTAAIPVAEKGAAFGVVPLDASTKINPIYLPSGAITFKGVWDAANNTPTLVDGVGANGDEYIVGVAGTQDLGSGNISFAVGDFVLYTAANVWVDIPVGGSGVDSFNGRTGIVTLNNGDVINALSAGSIVNSKLANPNVTITTGAGLTGGGVLNLGGSLTLVANVANIVGGTGVTVTPSAGTYTVAIGQPVGTANSVQFSSVTSTTTIQATGNITGGNLTTGGQVVATGNITTQGYVKTPNTTINNGIVTTGNVSAAYFIGNGSLLTGLNAYGNVYANGTAVVAGNGSATLTVTPGNNQVITGNNTSKVVTIAVNDNPTFANVVVTGDITISGNINTANTTYLSNVGNILFSNTAPLGTAYPGTMEYDGRVLYFTPQDQERGVVPNQQWYVLNADRGLTYGSTAAQSLFGVGAHVSNSTRYWFRIKATVSRAAGTNNTALTLGWRGTATMSKLNFTAQASIGAVSTPTSSTTYETTLISGFTAQTVVTGTNNPPDSTTLVIQGIIDVGAAGAGTVEPFISWTGATAPGSVTVSSLSYFQLFPVGVTGQNTNVGNWA